MEQYNSIQQILKKENGHDRKPIYPSTVIQAVFDAKTGASLEAILAQFNSIYVQYQGSPQATRNIIPVEMRRAGLMITYMNMDSETIIEKASSAVQKDNDHWGLDVNWSRVDELSLSGDIAVSAQGTWIINGVDTKVPARGSKGDAGLTPWLKTINNKLNYSYDNVNWTECSDNIAHWFRINGNKLQISSDQVSWEDVSDYIASYFRFNATSSDSQAGTIGKIQISRDNKTWQDLSPEFRNYLRIQGYVSSTSALPKNQVVGTIYGVNEDTNTYSLHVWDGSTWVNNGTFTSIAAGVVQETGDSETEVMSQKAVTEKLSELGSEVEERSLDIESEIGGVEGEVTITEYSNVWYNSEDKPFADATNLSVPYNTFIVKVLKGQTIDWGISNYINILQFSEKPVIGKYPKKINQGTIPRTYTSETGEYIMFLVDTTKASKMTVAYHNSGLNKKIKDNSTNISNLVGEVNSERIIANHFYNLSGSNTIVINRVNKYEKEIQLNDWIKNSYYDKNGNIVNGNSIGAITSIDVSELTGKKIVIFTRSENQFYTCTFDSTGKFLHAYNSFNNGIELELNNGEHTIGITTNVDVIPKEVVKAYVVETFETQIKKDKLEQGYFYNTNGLSIGDYKLPVKQNNEIRSCCVFKVEKGTRISLKTKTDSGIAGALCPIFLTDEYYKIYYKNESINFDSTSIAFEVGIEKDGWAFVHCNTDSIDLFGVEIISVNQALNELRSGSKKKAVYNSDILSIEGYYNFNGLGIGSIAPTSITNLETKKSCRLKVKEGDCFLLKSYTTVGVAGYSYPWVLTDNDYVIIDMPTASTVFNLVSGQYIEIKKDGWLYLSCNTEYFELFSIEEVDEIDVLKANIKSVANAVENEKTTNNLGLVLSNKKIMLSGASISQYNGYFEYAMDVLGLSYINISVAGNNIFHLCNELYKNGTNYDDVDVLMTSHIHNYNVFDLPSKFDTYTALDYESDGELSDYIKTTNHISGTIESIGNYTVDEMYAIGYDYAIKKWSELCYNLRGSNGYDSLIGKPCQIVLYTYWHDGRTTFNNAIRKLAKKWGLMLIKDDENIGFSKNRIHPIAKKQVSVLYCNGIPWSSKTEDIDGVTYGFHPSGIAQSDWQMFVAASVEDKRTMLPYIQQKRASILIDAIKNSIL